MDPLTALSLASSVVQFIDFGLKILERGSEIKRSADGAVAQNEAIEDTTRDLQNLLLKLRIQPQASTGTALIPEQISLERLVKGCEETASQLLTKLETLKPRSKRGWNTIRAALISAWSEKDVQEISERLTTYQRELSLNVLVSLRECTKDLKIEQSENFKSLDRTLCLGIVSILNNQDAIIKEFHRQIDLIIGNSIVMLTDTSGASLRKAIERQQERNLRTIHQRDPGPPGQPFVDEQFFLLEELEKEKKEKELFSALSFEVMKDRQDQIKDSYKQTFEWIFGEPKSSTRPWNNFSTWLKQTNSSLYWINGKAASGKSTLMGFLCDHHKTNVLLSYWSRNTRLISASFFFWNSGASLQRSQKGLLRSLLWQILSREPALVPIAFPNFLTSDFLGHQWKITELEDRLRNICQYKLLPCNIFLFVDGLDEYEGEYWSLSKLFKDLSNSPNVKICVSSRPLTVFDKAFEGFPSLRLEHLTYEDISFYVTDMLDKNELMEVLREREGRAEVNSLISDIVNKANGVWLWVELVVMSLLSGLTNDDDLSILKARVDALPTELESLYEHMLKNIHAVYRRSAYELITLMVTQRSDSFSLQDMYFAYQEPGTSLQMEVAPLGPKHQRQYYRYVEVRLKTHCLGLLELAGTHVWGFEGLELNPRIDYIHRTAREFLETRSVLSALLQDSNQNAKAFDPYLSHLSGSVGRLKTISYTDTAKIIKKEEHIVDMARWAINYATMVKNENRSEMVCLLDELEKTMLIHWQLRLHSLYSRRSRPTANLYTARRSFRYPVLFEILQRENELAPTFMDIHRAFLQKVNDGENVDHTNSTGQSSPSNCTTQAQIPNEVSTREGRGHSQAKESQRPSQSNGNWECTATPTSVISQATIMPDPVSPSEPENRRPEPTEYARPQLSRPLPAPGPLSLARTKPNENRLKRLLGRFSHTSRLKQ